MLILNECSAAGKIIIYALKIPAYPKDVRACLNDSKAGYEIKTFSMLFL